MTVPLGIRRAFDQLVEQRVVSYVLVAGSAAFTLLVLLERHVRTGELDELAGQMLVGTLLLSALVAVGWRRAVLKLPPALDVRLVVALSGVLLLIAVAGPVRRSHDLWSYTMYGREVSVHHVSPYTHVPSEFPGDPFLARVSPMWRSTGSVYGPLFTGYSAVATKLAGDSVLRTRLAFQALAGLAVFGSVLILARRKVDPVAIACLGLHPLVVIYAVGGGHNDPVVGLGILVGVLLTRSRRAGWAGLVIGLAALVKIVAGIAAVALVVWLWSHTDRTRRRDAVRLSLACGATVLLGYAAAGGVSALGPLRHASQSVGWASMWAPVRHALGASSLAEHVSSLAVASVLGVAAVLLVRHRHDHGPEVMVMGALLAYQLCSAYVLVWYLLWVLPLGVMRWRTLTGQALLAYATVLLWASSYHPARDDELMQVLFGHGLVLHAFALLTAVVLVVAAVRPRRGMGSTSAHQDGQPSGADGVDQVLAGPDLALGPND